MNIEDYKDKKHVVMLSGGASSYVAAKRVISWYGKENVTLLFADTLTEDEDLYRFLGDIEQKFQMSITRIDQGLDIWDTFKKHRFIGNSRADVCSLQLKRNPMDAWVKQRYPDPDSVVLWVGIGLFEQHRLERLQPRKLPYIYHSPLLVKPWLVDLDLLKEVENDGLKVPRLYDLGFSHNNCGGFCIKAGKAHFKQLLKTMPERFAHHERKEQELRVFLDKDVSVLSDKKMVRGKTTSTPLTLEQFRKNVEAEQKGLLTLPLEYEHDFRGCACFFDLNETEERASA